VFAAWGKPSDYVGFWSDVLKIKWYIVAALLAILGYMIKTWFSKDEVVVRKDSTWEFTKRTLPFFGGVAVAGLLMGRPGTGVGLIPSQYIASLVRGNSLLANLAASIIGAFMYFATLTEIPIIQGLMRAAMG
jgi:uncharacterized membrane protein YraQ (UPF0718 family)